MVHHLSDGFNLNMDIISMKVLKKKIKFSDYYFENFEMAIMCIMKKLNILGIEI